MNPVAAQHARPQNLYLNTLGPGHDAKGRPVWGQTQATRPDYARALATDDLLGWAAPSFVHIVAGFAKEALVGGLTATGELARHVARTHVARYSTPSNLMPDAAQTSQLPWSLRALNDASAVLTTGLVMPLVRASRELLRNPQGKAQALQGELLASGQQLAADFTNPHHTPESSTALGTTLALFLSTGRKKFIGRIFAPNAYATLEREVVQGYVRRAPDITTEQLARRITAHSDNPITSFAYDPALFYGTERLVIELPQLSGRKAFGFDAMFSSKSNFLRVQINSAFPHYPELDRVWGNGGQMFDALFKRLPNNGAGVQQLTLVPSALVAPGLDSGKAIDVTAIRAAMDRGLQIKEVLIDPPAVRMGRP